MHSENSNKRSGITLWECNQLLIFTALIGVGLSLYAFTVELRSEQNENYKPFCDISEYMSCTKAFHSQYGRGFGIFSKDSIFYKPNSFFGIVFYNMVATLSFSNSPVAVNGSLLIITLSNFASLYFSYILYFILTDLCIVCIGTYVINVVCLILITIKHRMVRELKLELKKKSKIEEEKSK